MRGAQLARALRQPNFRLFFAGQLASLSGSWVQQTALGLQPGSVELRTEHSLTLDALGEVLKEGNIEEALAVFERATVIDRRLWHKADSDCRFYSFLYHQRLLAVTIQFALVCTFRQMDLVFLSSMRMKKRSRIL